MELVLRGAFSGIGFGLFMEVLNTWTKKQLTTIDIGTQLMKDTVRFITFATLQTVFVASLYTYKFSPPFVQAFSLTSLYTTPELYFSGVSVVSGILGKTK